MVKLDINAHLLVRCHWGSNRWSEFAADLGLLVLVSTVSSIFETVFKFYRAIVVTVLSIKT